MNKIAILLTDYIPYDNAITYVLKPTIDELSKQNMIDIFCFQNNNKTPNIQIINDNVRVIRINNTNKFSKLLEKVYLKFHNKDNNRIAFFKKYSTEVKKYYEKEQYSMVISTSFPFCLHELAHDLRLKNDFKWIAYEFDPYTMNKAIKSNNVLKHEIDTLKIADYIFVETVTDIWPEYSKELGQKPRYEHMIAEKNPVCIQPFDLLNIFADGVVSPCCADWKRCLALGSITQTPLTELWRGEKLFALRSALLKGIEPAPCNQCAFPVVSQSDYIDEAKADILERIAGEKEYA